MGVAVRPAVATDLEAALSVWLAANIARGLPPSPQRIERIREKLSAGHVIVLVAVADDSAGVVGMAQVEPLRSPDGTTAADGGHISMVFVHPDRQGEGIGAALMRSLEADAVGRGWTRLSLWTRSTNHGAQRLYAGHGFALTGDSAVLDDGDAIDRWERTVAG